MQPILESEIKDLQTAETKYEYDNEELCQALDLLTLVEFKIGSKNEAFKRNEEAMAVAKSSLGSLFSRGNRIHLLWKNGYSIEVRTELNELDRIKDDALRNGSCIIIAAVKAQQAYCYFRFGVLWSLEKAIALYEEALDSFPEMHLWRLQAGQAYRRVSHPNMHGEKNIDLKLIRERKEKADVFFHHVTNHSKNPRLQAFAFSDLAVAAFARKEEGGDLKNFCDKALTLGGNHPYVLLNCGKSLKYKDIKKAVKLFTKATEISPTTHTFHQLGNCLHHFSYKQKKNQQVSQHLAKQAEESYRKAIGIDPHNIPACYSLGRFFRLHGKVDMASRVFTQIIREFQYEDFAITLMKVYEQASMCLLTLYYDPAYSSCLTEEMKLEMKKDAEEMLIKALSISYKFLSPQEIQIYLIESLSSVQDITDTQGTPEALLLLSRVHRLAKDPEKSLIALKKLVDIDMSEDPHVTTSTIETYIDLGCFEEALALMNRSIACNKTLAIHESLYNKVVFNAARSRLLRYGGDAAFVFKSVFDSYRLKRHGFGTSSVASSKIDIFDSSNNVDILIIYDDSQRSVGDICRKLQKVMNKVFGLNVSNNLDRCCAGIPQAYA
ncbi:tpr repeat-containing protein yrrb [Plakobranchus ocellatus]|uniref:Tpr repeat-containing protein yrrb n=1 Tax=Plakobranchus ocellatus TaxID=259542 RepID=A0AAV3ZPG5_9GAST|nr:tpr repeat-containing protein yrrb [Plakobranchus ocellatus]